MTTFRVMIGQRLRFGAAAVLIMAAVGGCAQKQEAPPLTQSPSGTVRMVDLAQLDSLLTSQRGRWVLVNIWATWCRPCVAETPELVALHKSLGDKPFTMVGLSADFATSPTESQAIDKVSQFRVAFQVTYPLVVFSGSIDDLTSRFTLTGAIPTTVLYNPQGLETERWVGRLSGPDFERVKSLVS